MESKEATPVSNPSRRFVVSGGRATGLLGVGTMFVATLIAGEWGFAASIVVIAILVGYYDSGKHRRQLDSTVRRYRE